MEFIWLMIGGALLLGGVAVVMVACVNVDKEQEDKDQLEYLRKLAEKNNKQ